jgi:hypothetical protein
VSKFAQLHAEVAEVGEVLLGWSKNLKRAIHKDLQDKRKDMRKVAQGLEP